MNALGKSLPPLSTLLPFEAAARLESFSRAADELHLTQAAVSRQIRALETSLGQALFERRNRGVFLTPAGRELARVVSLSLGNLAQHAEALRGTQRESQVILFCQLCEAFYWLMPRLSKFHQRHPEIDIKLTTSTRPLTEQREPFDIALQTYGRPSGSHELAFTAADEILPVCSPIHPAASAAPLPLDELLGFTLLHHRADSPDWMEWDAWLGAMGHSVTGLPLGKAFDSYPLLLQAAVAGHGVALGWRRTTERLIAAGELIAPVKESLTQSDALAIYLNQGGLDRRARRVLLDWLAEELNSEEWCKDSAVVGHRLSGRKARSDAGQCLG